MVFSSFIFLWIFLPIVFIGYFLLQDKYKNIFLLFGSLIFYAWGEPLYILLMLFSILINYVFGILIDKDRPYRNLLLIISLIFNIGILGYYKYVGFLVEVINNLTGRNIELPDVALPIGISFYTFQILSYIIDVYRGESSPQKNIINLALYISFFPQLIAGPIVKYKNINEQLINRKCTIEKTGEGIRRFIIGLGKKIIIANTVAKCADAIFALDLINVTGILAWMGAICYTLQIYYDFSGYSDMAIGLGRIFGFEFQENFRYPYLSASVQEFWQRWHISLGTWFREYLYIPLGGNRMGNIRTYINLFVVFCITGLWHGANYNFLLWGGAYGILQIIERMGFKRFLTKHRLFSHIYMVLIFTFGWVLFRADPLKQVIGFMERMILPWKYKESMFVTAKIFGNKTVLIIILGILGCGIVQQLLAKMKLFDRLRNSYLEIIYCGFIFVLCISMLAGNTYNPFIYFKF